MAADKATLTEHCLSTGCFKGKSLVLWKDQALSGV